MSTNNPLQTNDDEPTGQQELSEAATDRSDVDLMARVELLAAENKRLREEYARARRSQYRTTAVGFAVIGTAALSGGLLFPDVRDVLVALGVTGLFGAVLIRFLTPGQFVAADVGERIYDACARNQTAIAEELGLQDTHYYLPARGRGSTLYVPRYATDNRPEEITDNDGPFVLEEESAGLLLEPTGSQLFIELARGLPGEVGTTPRTIATQLSDGIVEQFELAESATSEVEPDDGRITVGISNSAFGGLDRFDHPIVSIIATGVAVGLDRPVTVEVDAGGHQSDWLVTCRFESDVEDRQDSP